MKSVPNIALRDGEKNSVSYVDAAWSPRLDAYRMLLMRLQAQMTAKVADRLATEPFESLGKSTYLHKARRS